MYEGPVIDSFLHSPWIGSAERAELRADHVPWTADRRLRRVMQTFHHPTAPGGLPPRLTGDETLRRLDAAGVTGGILVAKVYYPSNAGALDILHEELAEISVASGERLKWVATVVPPEHGPGSYWDLMASVRTLDKIAAMPGLVGVHITPSPWGLAPNDRWYYPVYTRCVDLGLALFSYVGAPGPLWPMDPNNPKHLDDVALGFPDLRIVAHHIGDPWTDIMVRLAARHENVMICTSAWHPKSYPPALRDFMKGKWHGQAGCDRVMFASDFPLMDIDKTVHAARSMDLGDEQLEAILYGNAKRWFFEDETAR